MAELTADPESKQRMLHIATEYEKVAERAETRRDEIKSKTTP
jgi:hypothetical protein